MTLKDLKTGMIVKIRNGEYHIIMRDFIDAGDVLAGLSCSNIISGTWTSLSNYNQDMTHPTRAFLDIVNVYASSVYSADTPTRLLWERNEYKEVTMKEIEEKFWCKVKIIEDKAIEQCNRRVNDDID